MSLQRTVLRMIEKHGETMTLARASEGTTISLKGKRFGSSDEEIGGGAAQAAITVKIGTAELLASAWTDKFPKRLDTVILGGRTRTVVDHPDSRKEGDVTVLHILTVVG